MKDTAASAELIVEESTAPEVVKTGFDHRKSQEGQGAAVLAQYQRPNVVVPDPIPQLKFQLDVVEEKKLRKFYLGKVSSGFKIKSRKQRYVKR